VLQSVAVCCSVLQCAAMCCCSVLQCVAVSCIVLQCVVMCCSVLQCVPVYGGSSIQQGCCYQDSACVFVFLYVRLRVYV